jgi:hypothetical protein
MMAGVFELFVADVQSLLREFGGCKGQSTGAASMVGRRNQ